MNRARALLHVPRSISKLQPIVHISTGFQLRSLEKPCVPGHLRKCKCVFTGPELPVMSSLPEALGALLWGVIFGGQQRWRHLESTLAAIFGI